jgi:beta-N-acetylhexosaminidase
MHVRKKFSAWMARTLVQAGMIGTGWMLAGWADGPGGEKPMAAMRALTDPVFLHSPAAWVDSVMATLTPEQRIAQMIMVAAYSNQNPDNEAMVMKLIRENGIGGVVFFQGTPYRQAVLTNRYQAASRVPLLVAMDAEWGPAMRLDSTVRYPRQMMLGAIEDDRMLFDMGGQVAEQLKRLGVHINFAPVVDVNVNPRNPVINSRSFGDNRDNVTRKALFYMIGMENKGILTVAKHFPGHGDTQTDSHEDMPVILQSRQRLDSIELYPYREMIAKGVSGILASHLELPAIEPRKKIPASLSPRVLDTLLRNELGFKGLIFTDAMNMKGITNFFKPVEAGELAVLAGNDVLVMPGEVPDLIERVTRLIKRGKISQEDIDLHCRRILAAKYYAGLHAYRPVDLNHLYSDLNKPEYRQLQRKLFGSALTVLQNHNNLVPLRHLDTLRTASLIFSRNNDSIFAQDLALYMPVKNYLVGRGGNAGDSLLQELKKHNLIIAGIQTDDFRANLQYGISDATIRFLDTLATLRPVVLVVFGNPYLLDRFRDPGRFASVILAYENAPEAQELASMLVFGATGASGHIPVTAGLWKSNQSGIPVEAVGRLQFALPADAMMNEDTLNGISAVIADAIDKQALPGCEILVARKGKVVYYKAFGSQKYAYSRPVHRTDLYDLASVTKIVGTTTATMKLVDEGRLDITCPLSQYLPYLAATNKKDMVIRDVLVHQAGLVEFIQFYYSCLEPVFRGQSLISTKQTDINSIMIGRGAYMNRYTRYKAAIVSDHWSPQFPLKVADNMYFVKSWTDTVFNGIAASPLRKKQYVYSDLGLMLIKQAIDTITRQPFQQYLDDTYYKKLGAGTLCFNPLERFPREVIAPTEDDHLFRKQQLQGYVHDPRAAMLGGIAGHAGLFANAMDLAKVLQMWLNRGEYGGDRFVEPATVDLFTKRQEGYAVNRRGLGWDKPDPDPAKPQPVCKGPSLLSYGHTGFTGNMIWVDPAYDLIYIFLSNRVYPDAENTRITEMSVRTRVQQLVYNAMTDR